MSHRSLFRAVTLLLAVLVAAGTVTAQGGGMLTFDGPLEEVLAEGRVHTYTFRSAGDEALSVRLSGALPLDPVLELYAPDGNLIAFNDDAVIGQPDAALVDVILAQPGVYTLLARSFGNRGGGAYRLLAELGAAETLDTSAPVEFGELVVAELFVEGQVDRWTFAGAAGQVVSAAMNAARGSRVDPLLELLGPDGTVLASSDDDGGDVNSLINGLTLPEAGTYTIVARSWGNRSLGEYTLELAEGWLQAPGQDAAQSPATLAGADVPPVGQADTIVIGQTVAGTLAAGMMDTYQFDADAGVTVGIALSSVEPNLDPWLEVIDADGSVLAYDDDSGGDRDSRIRALTLAEAGVYTIRVRSYLDSGSGAYRLVMAEVAPVQVNSGPITPGQTIRATLYEGQRDTWMLEAAAGQSYSIAVYAVNNDFDPMLRVLDAAGNEVASDDDGGPNVNSMLVGWTALADGLFTIQVGSFSGLAVGQYTVTVQEGAQFVLPEGWLQGALRPGETLASGFYGGPATQVWTFEAAADTYFRLETTGAVFAEVLDAAGLYASYFEPEFPLHIEAAGQYYLLVHGFQEGDFTLRLEQVPAPPRNSGEIGLDQTIRASLAAGVEDEWAFAGQAGEVVSIGLYAEAEAFDTLLRLVDADGVEIASDDDGGFFLNSAIRALVLPYDGQYVLLVSSFDRRAAGPYALTVQAGVTAALPAGWEQGVLEDGLKAEGNLTADALTQVWTYQGLEGQQLTVTYRGAAKAQLLDGEGHFVAEIQSGVPQAIEWNDLYYLVLGAEQPTGYALEVEITG